MPCSINEVSEIKPNTVKRPAINPDSTNINAAKLPAAVIAPSIGMPCIILQAAVIANKTTDSPNALVSAF